MKELHHNRFLRLSTIAAALVLFFALCTGIALGAGEEATETVTEAGSAETAPASAPSGWTTEASGGGSASGGSVRHGSSVGSAGGAPAPAASPSPAPSKEASTPAPPPVSAPVSSPAPSKAPAYPAHTNTYSEPTSSAATAQAEATDQSPAPTPAPSHTAKPPAVDKHAAPVAVGGAAVLATAKGSSGADSQVGTPVADVTPSPAAKTSSGSSDSGLLLLGFVVIGALVAFLVFRYRGPLERRRREVKMRRSEASWQGVLHQAEMRRPFAAVPPSGKGLHRASAPGRRAA